MIIIITVLHRSVSCKSSDRNCSFREDATTREQRERKLNVNLAERMQRGIV